MRLKKVCSVIQSTADFRSLLLLTESDHIELSRLCAGLQLQIPVYPTPTASSLAHRHRTFVTCRGMCNDLPVYASACVLRSKMTYAEKSDNSEGEVR